MITNDVSDYINLLASIAHIICNHPVFTQRYDDKHKRCNVWVILRNGFISFYGSHQDTLNYSRACAICNIAVRNAIVIWA
jgi:hypothetical protein